MSYDFVAQMDAAKTAAANRRYRGMSTGKAAAGHFKKRQPIEDSEENRLWATIHHLRAEIAERDRQLAGGEVLDDNHGAEFDRLFAGAKEVGQGLPSLPRVTAPSTRTIEGNRGSAMTTKQYLDALKKLRLTPSSRETAETLGLSVRQCQRIAAGETAVSETLAKLLAAYLEHGIPES